MSSIKALRDKVCDALTSIAQEVKQEIQNEADVEKALKELESAAESAEEFSAEREGDTSTGPKKDANESPRIAGSLDRSDRALLNKLRNFYADLQQNKNTLTITDKNALFVFISNHPKEIDDEAISLFLGIQKTELDEFKNSKQTNITFPLLLSLQKENPPKNNNLESYKKKISEKNLVAFLSKNKAVLSALIENLLAIAEGYSHKHIKIYLNLISEALKNFNGKNTGGIDEYIKLVIEHLNKEKTSNKTLTELVTPLSADDISKQLDPKKFPGMTVHTLVERRPARVQAEVVPLLHEIRKLEDAEKEQILKNEFEQLIAQASKTGHLKYAFKTLSTFNILCEMLIALSKSDHPKIICITLIIDEFDSGIISKAVNLLTGNQDIIEFHSKTPEGKTPPIAPNSLCKPSEIDEQLVRNIELNYTTERRADPTASAPSANPSTPLEEKVKIAKKRAIKKKIEHELNIARSNRSESLVYTASNIDRTLFTFEIKKLLNKLSDVENHNLKRITLVFEDHFEINHAISKYLLSFLQSNLHILEFKVPDTHQNAELIRSIDKHFYDAFAADTVTTAQNYAIGRLSPLPRSNSDAPPVIPPLKEMKNEKGRTYSDDKSSTSVGASQSDASSRKDKERVSADVEQEEIFTVAYQLFVTRYEPKLTFRNDQYSLGDNRKGKEARKEEITKRINAYLSKLNTENKLNKKLSRKELAQDSISLYNDCLKVWKAKTIEKIDQQAQVVARQIIDEIKKLKGKSSTFTFAVEHDGVLYKLPASAKDIFKKFIAIETAKEKAPDAYLKFVLYSTNLLKKKVAEKRDCNFNPFAFFSSRHPEATRIYTELSKKDLSSLQCAQAENNSHKRSVAEFRG